MPNAFISHSSPDDRYVTELVQLVRKLGFDDVFNDSHSIEPDDEFWPRIEKAILACDAFVVVLSHAAVQSYWVDREVRFARDNDKQVVPIRIDDCNLPESFNGRDVIELRPGRGDKVKIASSRIMRHAPDHLFGREQWLDELDAMWNASDRINVYSLIAWGGAGKTSVVAHWVAHRMSRLGWPGVERYFDWSFYSQGAREQSQASADLFIARALEFFGDPDPQDGDAWARGERLARLVRQHRTLLVLDGIEPLQYPVNSPLAGEFKDKALQALLQGLAMDNPGLCVLTSRETIKDLQTYRGGTAEEKQLNKLHKEAAISLLRHLQIVGTDQELEDAWRDVGGHALTLQLLGRFLADAHGGDIRRRNEVQLTEADLETPGRTAMKVLLAYEKWLESAGPQRGRDLAVLRLTGLFDRPASADCLAALRADPAIGGLTEGIVGLTDPQWRKALTDLETLGLVTLSADESAASPTPNVRSANFAVDAHPLVREYFSGQLRNEQPDAWRAAHRRLYEHLCASTKDKPDATLEDLQPLYQAVAHGCQAGLAEDARAKVYRDRIQRGKEAYSTFKLGALGSDLGAIACFFKQPWSELIPGISGQSWLVNEAAFTLRALGRLLEALDPMRVSGDMDVKVQEWKGAATSYGNLSELELTLGDVTGALEDAKHSVTYADRSSDALQRMSKRATHADALQQAGRRAEAEALFREAEQMQAESQPAHPLLYSLRGFKYCDLLLTEAERAAWQQFVVPPLGGQRAPVAATPPKGGTTNKELVDACRAVSERAEQTIKIAE